MVSEVRPYQPSTFLETALTSPRIARAAKAWFRRYALVLTVYVLAMWFTGAVFMADTEGYVVSILAYHGSPEYVVRDPLVGNYLSENPFWECGHLFWRPLGLVLFNTLGPLSRLVVGAEPGMNVFFLLKVVNWLAGLLSVFCLCAIVRRVTTRMWVANLATIAFVFSQGFLNFSQSGASYVSGLSLLLLGLYLLVRAEETNHSWLAASLAGMALAGAVCMWLPFVLAIPGTLIAPLLLFGTNKQRWQLAVRTAVTFGLAISLSYGIVMASFGIDTPKEMIAWLSNASHGVQAGGVGRAAIGFPRSLINMGNDGILFKRFLVHDSFNPVTVSELFRLSFWKLFVFYLFIASAPWFLMRSAGGRRTLALLLFGAAPLFIFAIRFDGGAVERYLPLYPFFFLGLAGVLNTDRVRWAFKAIPVVFIAAMIVTNSLALATSSVDRKEQAAAVRMQELVPRLKKGSEVVVSHLQDDLFSFQTASPFHPLAATGDYHFYAVIVPNTPHVDSWREEFASQAIAVWDGGGDIWISKRLLNSSPKAEWNWVEGADPRVSWRDINSFFAQMQTSDGAGNEDGFSLLSQSPQNKDALIGFARALRK